MKRFVRGRFDPHKKPGQEPKAAATGPDSKQMGVLNEMGALKNTGCKGFGRDADQ